MVIIESHGSNKVVNKLCCPLLNSLKGSGTPEVLNASRQKGTSAKVNNRAIALPSYLTSYPHTSNCADGLRSRSRSSLGNTSKRYDDSLLTSSQNHVSSIPQLSSVRPFCLGCDKTNKPASSEAITRSFTFVNSSTVASPKPTLSSVQKASPSCSDSLTNSSIYVETDDGNFHWRKRKRKLPVQDITSLLYSYLFGYKKLRLFVWYVIFIMCALIEGCMCSSLCAESPKMLPGFLQVDLNQSSVGPEQGQCLTMQNDFAEYVCDQSKANRMKAIRKVNTNFCGLPLYNILNNTEKDVIEQCSPSYGCLSTLRYIQNLDSQLSEIYCSFMDILDRMDCEDRYSYNGNCESCKVSLVFLYFSTKPI